MLQLTLFKRLLIVKKSTLEDFRSKLTCTLTTVFVYLPKQWYIHCWNSLNVFLSVTRGTEKKEETAKLSLRRLCLELPTWFVFLADSNVSLPNLSLEVRLLKFLFRNDQVPISDMKHGRGKKGLHQLWIPASEGLLLQYYIVIGFIPYNRGRLSCKLTRVFNSPTEKCDKCITGIAWMYFWASRGTKAATPSLKSGYIFPWAKAMATAE